MYTQTYTQIYIYSIYTDMHIYLHIYNWLVYTHFLALEAEHA